MIDCNWLRLILFTLSVASFGCSRYPTAPTRPSLIPGAASQQALESYDTNEDGQIDVEEAKASPGLTQAFIRIDSNGDQALSADEIADRIRYYKSAATTIISGGVEVTFAGRPLPGARVTFEPEPFLGAAFTDCSGVTDAGGITSLEGPDADFPGIYLGMYRVRISKETKGKEIVPEKYNKQTTLGYEAADDIPLVSRGILFNLEKK
jgi:hypothetical protein